MCWSCPASSSRRSTSFERNRRLPERDAESSRPAPHVRKLCRRQSAAVRDAAAGDFAVLNADDADLRGFCRTHAARWCGSAARTVEPGVMPGDDAIVIDGKPLMAAGEIPIRGRHNVENVMAAAIARAGGRDAGTDCGRGAYLPGVEHRMEFVRHFGGDRLLQRFEGHQRGCDSQSRRCVPRRAVDHSWRQG